MNTDFSAVLSVIAVIAVVNSPFWQRTHAWLLVDRAPVSGTVHAAHGFVYGVEHAVGG